MKREKENVSEQLKSSSDSFKSRMIELISETIDEVKLMRLYSFSREFLKE